MTWRKLKGYTLIEIMVVTAIIGVLASISLPFYQTYIQRAQVIEAISVPSTLKEDISVYYMETLEFPADNQTLFLPEPNLFVSSRITSIAVDSGVIHVTMGDAVSKPLHGKILSFRPAIVPGSVASPISWFCGYNEPVGLEVIGENKTDIEQKFLPKACRT